MKRSNPHATGILQIFGIHSYRSFVLPFPLWFIGFTVSVCLLLFPVFFWIDVFEFQGET
jgi:hypothetical protein